MIIPITISSKGETKEIGTARVIPDGDDFEVEFYLSAEFALSDQAKANLIKELKKIARKRHAETVKNLSIWKEE